MAITREGQGTSETTTITIPAHQVGDIIIISARRANNSPPTAPGAGGTVPTWNTIGSAGANTLSLTTAWARATATNHTSGTWSGATSMIVTVLRGAKATDSPIGGISPANGLGTQTIVYPALTLVVTDGTSYALRFGTRGTAAATVANPPGSFTNYASTPATPLFAAHSLANLTANISQESVSTPGTNAAYRAHTLEVLAESVTVTPATVAVTTDLPTPTIQIVVPPGYLNLVNSSGSRAETPDHNDLDITGDIDIRVLARIDDVALSNRQSFITKGRPVSSLNIASFQFDKPGAGANQSRLVFDWRNAGNSERFFQSDTGLAIQGVRWYRFTLDVDNGAGSRVGTFFYSDDPIDTAPDSVSWTQHSQHSTGETTAIQASAHPVYLGAMVTDGDHLAGRIYYAEIRNGIAGTKVANPDFRDDCQQDSSTQLTDDFGKVWTVNSPATWVDPAPCPYTKVRPASNGVVAALPTPAVLAGATTSPAAVIATTALPTPTVVTGAGAVVTPATITASVALPVPTAGEDTAVYTNLLIVDLSPSVDPGSDLYHFLRINARTDDGAGFIRLRLFQDTLLIAEYEFAPDGTFTIYEYELLEAEAAAITDYTDLQLHVDVKETTAPFTPEVDAVAFFTGYSNLITVELDDYGDPGTDLEHFLRAHARAAAGTGCIRLRLFQDATFIAGAEFELDGTFTTYSYELLEAEAAAITDYSDLQLYLDVRPTSLGPFTPEVDWVAFFHPLVETGPFPVTIEVTTALPTPTIITGAGVFVTPASIAVTTMLPTPAVQIAATVSPAAIAVTAVLPTPVTQAAVVVSPAVIAVTSTLPTPTVFAGAATTVNPAVIAVISTLPTPTVLAAVRVTPTVIAVTTAIPQPQLPRIVIPAAIVVTSTLPTPVTRAAVVVTPATIAVMAVLPTPTIISGAGVTKPVAVIAVTTSLPTPNVQAAAVVAPAVVTTTAVLPIPTITITAAATVTPVAIAVTTSLPTPTVRVAPTVTPATIAATTTLPTPTVVTGAATVVTPARITVTAALPNPSVIAGAVITPAGIAATAALPTPIAQIPATVIPTTIGLVVVIPVPSITMAVTVSPAVIMALTTLPVPTVRAAVLVAPNGIVVVTGWPTPNVIIGAIVFWRRDPVGYTRDPVAYVPVRDGDTSPWN